MSKVRTRIYTLHNGHDPVATMELPKTQDASPNNSLAFIFNHFDQMIHHRLKFLCLSPHTEPNPEGFKHDT